jgi:hypothetical protein
MNNTLNFQQKTIKIPIKSNQQCNLSIQVLSFAPLPWHQFDSVKLA